MKNDITSNFYFDNYIIKKIDLDFNQDFESEDPVNLEFDLDINTSIDQQEHTGWTQLDILIWDEAEKNNYPLTLPLISVKKFIDDKKLNSNEHLLSSDFYNPDGGFLISYQQSHLVAAPVFILQ